MMLKRSTSDSSPSRAARLLRAGLAGLALIGAASGLSVGCLDRPVTPAQPKTSNVVVDQIRQSAVDKIDLLFMIDNSVSMADKQAILQSAVPVLLGRLITPICVNPQTDAPIPGTQAPCPTGSQPEFSPINDIHIGIVSSSLGGHGGDVCKAAAAGQENVLDMAHLIGKIRGPGQVAMGAATVDPTTTWNSSGFLAWDPTGMKNTPAGDSNATALIDKFQNMVVAVGEHGCGFEAQLESWYRFLIDPDPPSAVGTAADPSNPGVTLTVTQGPDTEIINERKAFLRPDSLVAIIMLTDENDCSVADYGSGWVVGLNSGGAHLPPATAACATNPNDPCCRSCSQGDKGGCTPIAQDSGCATPLTGVTDSLNLRCYRQKQRFGFDLMYPIDRYVNGLRGLTVYDRNGSPGVNGLYAGSDTVAPRDPALVFFAGIIGVPWQDIATDATLGDPAHLSYRKAAELADRWPMILGDPTASPPVEPSDPYMVETFNPRSGSNPLTNTPIAPPTSTNPQESVINGHEQNVPQQDDLQYACTFRLGTPKVCMPGDNACDCSADKMGSTAAVTTANSPLCQPPQGGAPNTTQYFAKAYPGLRHLQVLKGFGENSIVASICPKVLDPNAPDYGYNPAVAAIIDRLKVALRGKCLPRPLAYQPDGSLPCKIVEAIKPKSGETCAGLCAAGPTTGRTGEADAVVRPAVITQLQATGACNDQVVGQECNNYCFCAVAQEQGDDLAACQTNTGNPPPGVCYVDQAIVDANNGAGADLLKNCPATDKRLLRFVSGDVPLPRQGAIGFFACTGSPVAGAQ